MKLTRRHKIILKIAGFTLLVALMFILNKNHHNQQENDLQSTNIELVNGNEGTVTASANIPSTTEHSLPINLLSNTKANFLCFVNESKDKLRTVKFIHQKWLFLELQTHLSSSYLIIKYITAKK